MEETTNFQVEKTGKIMRRLTCTFLQQHQYFTTTPVLLILPFSASMLFPLAVSPSSSTICSCFNSILNVIGLATPLPFVRFVDFNLSQTIFSSVLGLPFALTSLIIAKAFIIQGILHHKSVAPLPFSSFLPLYKPMLLTQLCSWVCIIFVNVFAFSILFISLYYWEEFGHSASSFIVLLPARAVFYCMLSNASVICNLALVVSGVEKCKAYVAIRKAFLMSWGKNSTLISLNLPVNLSMVAVGVLFQFRVVKAHRLLGRVDFSMALEGLFIAYMYSLLIVLDTISSCLFFKSRKADLGSDHGDKYRA